MKSTPEGAGVLPTDSSSITNRRRTRCDPHARCKRRGPFGLEDTIEAFAILASASKGAGDKLDQMFSAEMCVHRQDVTLGTMPIWSSVGVRPTYQLGVVGLPSSALPERPR